MPCTDVFGDAFFDTLDCVTNALDNVLARPYLISTLCAPL
jgi:hypothetical protein